jgi:hypothetical protein
LWYSLRDAETSELLLAAFSDPGPRVEPRMPGEEPTTAWLAPFEGVLGDLVCPTDPLGCEGDDSPRRGLAHFLTDDAEYPVLSGTEADLGDYRIHLGFAGLPDICELVPTNNPIEGFIVRAE